MAGNKREPRREIPEKDSDAAKWIEEKAAEGAKPNTLRAYRQAIARIGCLTAKPLADLTREDYNNLLNALNGSKSVGWHSTVLRMYLSWKGRDVSKWVRRKHNGESDSKWKDPASLLTREEVAKMVAGEPDKRNAALIALLWDCGCRIHEALALDIADVQEKDRTFSVWFKKRKIAGTERRVTLYESGTALRAWLSVHPLAQDGGPLFVTSYNGKHGRMAYSAGFHVIKAAAFRVGITKRVFPHLLRHSRATDLRVHGVSDDAIRLRMGWVRGSDMISRYVSLADEQADEEIGAKLGLAKEKKPVPVRKLELGADIPKLSDREDEIATLKADLRREIREEFSAQMSKLIEGISAQRGAIFMKRQPTEGERKKFMREGKVVIVQEPLEDSS